MKRSERARSAFVNCPFDAAFRPLFDAIVFTLTFCGFTVRSALEVRDSGEARLLKIIRLLEGCRFSVHDISRVELDDGSGLPRFNMPIELGIALGMKHLGRAELTDHAMLVLDAERYRYQMFASDLAGVDIAAHGGETNRVIDEVRGFLASQNPGRLPGAAAIHDALLAFERDLPRLAGKARQRADELTYADRLAHLVDFVGSLA